LLGIMPKIVMYKSFRKINFPRLLPMNLTVSVTYKCNSRCKTCNVWKKRDGEFSLEEFDKTFKNLGAAPYWFTMSGGEPFLRKDIVEICESAYKNGKPAIINIPTNGLLCNLIPEKTAQIVKSCPKAQIIINLSLDETGERHDEIRGAKNGFKKALKTYEELKKLDSPNLTLGIHTVISKFNVKRIPQIYEELIKLKPDSYITEIAEERIELDTVGSAITPSLEDYSRAVDFLSERMKEQNFSGISKTTQLFRLQYYSMVKKVLKKKRQIVPCYAGFASAHIAPDGEVWFCCIKADPIGNLKEVDYDFRKIWFSEKANKIRETIKRKECYCPMANASYTNMLCDLKTLSKVGWGEIV